MFKESRKNKFGSSVKMCSSDFIALQSLKLFQGIKLNDYLCHNHLLRLCKVNLTDRDNLLYFIDFKYCQPKNCMSNLRNIYVKWGGLKWGPIFRSYSLNVPLQIAYLLKIILSLAHQYCMSEATFIEFLKKVGANALHLASLGELDFLYLINLEILGGYDTINNRKNVIEEQRVKVTQIPDTTYSVNDRFKKAVDTFIDKIDIKPISRHQTLREFISYRDNWAIGTSCTHGKSVKITKAKYPYDKLAVMKGKLYRLSAYSNCELVTSCLHKRDCYISTFIKRDEPAKCRNIQSFDVYSYLRCSYFESFIHRYDTTDETLNLWTSIGLEPHQLSLLFERYSTILSNSGIYALSIDQSEFDMHQPLAAIKYCITSLVSHIANKAHSSYRSVLTSLLEAELHALDHMYVLGSSKEVLYKWVHGLPSGYKFTALIGSLLNAALNQIILDDLKVSRVAAVYQGDDALILLKPESSVRFLDVLARRYEHYGLILNISKSMFSSTAFEYLKHFYHSKHVFGIPVRAYKSIVWRKPRVIQLFESSATQFQNHLASLRMCTRRGCLYITKNIVAILFTLLQQFDYTASRLQLIDCMFTPLVYKGMGFGYFGRSTLSFSRILPKQFLNTYQLDQTTIHPSLRTKYYLFMLKLRVIDYVAIPNVKTTLIISKVLNPQALQNFDVNNFMINNSVTPLQLNWPSDKYKGFHAYNAKLKLEYYLHTNKPIPYDCVCDKRLSRIRNPHLLLRIHKTYNSYAEPPFSFENSRYSILTYSQHATTLYDTWRATISYMLLHLKFRDLPLIMLHFRTLAYNVLVNTTINKALSFSF